MAIKYEEAKSIVRKKIPANMLLLSSGEYEDCYVFSVAVPNYKDDDVWDGVTEVSVNKETGEAHDSDMKTFYEIFDPAKLETYNTIEKYIDGGPDNNGPSIFRK